MYVCMHTYMYQCILIHISIYVSIYVCMHIHILCRQTCMNVYVCSMNVCIGVARHEQVYACMFPCKYVCIYVEKLARMFSNVYV